MSEERLRNEQEFHDRQAAERARALRLEDHCFSDDGYLRHATWIAPSLDALGDVHGRRVLDLGCGHGMASVVLARRGARVTACDLSLEYVREAKTRSDANNVRSQFVVCNAESLPFADATFDRIWGNAILHHLDLRRTAKELHRVMAPGGVAVFCEPWGGNRWLEWARRRLPYPQKQRTADECPLRRRDLDHLRAYFPNMTTRGDQLFSMLGRVITSDRLVSGLVWCDAWILRQFPHWQNYCRYMIVMLSK